MRLGFLTNYSPERVVAANQMGFSCLEIFAPSLPLDDDDALKKVLETCEEKGIAISALAFYDNHFEAGKEKEQAAFFTKVLHAAPKLNCGVVATMSGCTPESQASGNVLKTIPVFKTYFSEHAKIAEDNNLKIAFENWPGGHPSPLLINIAFSPMAWDAMFDAVPSLALGLEYDPSHLVRLNIEYLPIIKRYAERIHHVHGKDTTIDVARLNEVGYIGADWWRYSIPSLGVVNWDAVFAELKAIGYDGDVDIEHEDDAYSGDNFDEGLKIGQQFLSQYVK